MDYVYSSLLEFIVMRKCFKTRCHFLPEYFLDMCMEYAISYKFCICRVARNSVR